MRVVLWIMSGLALAGFLTFGSAAQAQDIGLRVVGVAQNDVLNIREFPTSQSRILDIVPPNGRGLVFLNERHGDWVLIRFGKTIGWVNQRFVMPEVAGWVSRGYKLD